MEKQPDSRMCFVCGIENPIGLDPAFYTDDEGWCIARLRAGPEHQGYPGQLHGGIMSSLLSKEMEEVYPQYTVAMLPGRPAPATAL